MTDHAMAAAHVWQDWVLVSVAVIVTIVTTVYTVRALIRPGEKGEDHIKRRVIDDAREASR